MFAVYSAFVDNKKKRCISHALHVFSTHIVSHVLQITFCINYRVSVVSSVFYVIGK